MVACGGWSDDHVAVHDAVRLANGRKDRLAGHGKIIPVLRAYP
jgi:hypothetical protein